MASMHVCAKSELPVHYLEAACTKAFLNGVRNRTQPGLDTLKPHESQQFDSLSHHMDSKGSPAWPTVCCDKSVAVTTGQPQTGIIWESRNKEMTGCVSHRTSRCTCNRQCSLNFTLFTVPRLAVLAAASSVDNGRSCSQNGGHTKPCSLDWGPQRNYCSVMLE